MVIVVGSPNASPRDAADMPDYRHAWSNAWRIGLIRRFAQLMEKAFIRKIEGITPIDMRRNALRLLRLW